jgi:hypothetical protein
MSQLPLGKNVDHSTIPENKHDNFTLLTNSHLPNFADISICNKTDLIIAFDSSARVNPITLRNFRPPQLVHLH